jgi:hypothetical protein
MKLFLNQQLKGKRFSFARVTTRVSLVLFVFLLLYTYVRSEIIFHGSLDEKYFKYYLISIAGVVCFGVLVWVNDQIKLNVMMVVSSLVVGCYLIEITLYTLDRPVGPEQSSIDPAKILDLGVEFDTRSKFQVYQDLKNSGVDAVPSVPAPIFFWSKDKNPLIPFAGISGKTTVNCNESGKYSTFLSDRYGFNNPDSEWDLPEIEWVLVGDSYTQGACVNSGEEISAQIRSITGEGVINLGNAGNGPLIELATLKEYGELIKPKKVLWLFYANDLGNLETEKSESFLMNYLQSNFSQNLIHRQSEIDISLLKYIEGKELNIKGNVDKELKKNAKYYSKTEVLRLYNLRQIIKFDLPSIDKSFSEILKKAKDRTVAMGAELYFIYLPTIAHYKKGALTRRYYGMHERVIEQVKSLGIPVIDINQKVFLNHPDPLSFYPYRQFPHYTAQGYSEVAKAIVSSVK